MENSNKTEKKASIKWKNGSYSIGIIAVMIVIVVVINLIVEKLPSNIKETDISTNQIYSIGDTTKEVLNNLDQDVEIILLSEEKNIDQRIEQLIDHYVSESKHITKKVIDPVLHPSALTEYDTTANNIVVKCEATGKQRVIGLNEMILYDQMAYYYYGQYKETEFDGEGQITSAVSYVSQEEGNKLYTTEGHGETDFSETITDLISKGNIETGSVNLLTERKISDDCDLLAIYQPESDLADDEKDIILSYLQSGGKVMIILGSQTEKLPNLEAVMEQYGLKMADGYIADTQRFYQNSYYNIFPVLDTTSEVNNGIGEDSLALVINARGMTVEEELREGLSVEGFMSTSESGYTVDENGNKAQGTYLLGAVAEEEIQNATAGDATPSDAEKDSENKARLTVISAGSLIQSQITDSFTNLANTEIFMNAVTSNFEETENISIPTKSLEITYNTVKNPNTWGMIFIGVIPVGLIVIGLMIWIRRKRA